VQDMDEDETRVQAEENLGAVERETTGLRDTIFDIDTRVTLATISATLIEKEPGREPTRPDVIGSFGAALSSLWALTLRLASSLAWVLVYSPVWGIALVIGLLSYRHLRRGGQ